MANYTTLRLLTHWYYLVRCECQVEDFIPEFVSGFGRLLPAGLVQLDVGLALQDVLLVGVSLATAMDGEIQVSLEHDQSSAAGLSGTA